MLARNDRGTGGVPRALKAAFVVHFILDVVSAVPLMLAPVAVLTWLGWQDVDPITTRMVAAALFGIGIESWLGRNAGAAAYRGMLNLKIIWSAGAVAGLIASLVQMGRGGPLAGWFIVVLFVAFNGLWIFWRIRLPRAADSAAQS